MYSITARAPIKSAPNQHPLPPRKLSRELIRWRNPLALALAHALAHAAGQPSWS